MNEFVKKLMGWSPSRKKKYDDCPAWASYEYLDKLCPLCFKGQLTGWDPLVCSACGGTPDRGEALERGIAIDRDIEGYLTGKLERDQLSFTFNLEVMQLLDLLRMDPGVSLQHDIVLNDRWQPISKFTKGAWLRTKLDALVRHAPDEYEVIDWKSGGIDKRSGKVRPRPEYADQLEIYSAAVLSSIPRAEVVRSKLAFVDAPDRADPFVAGEPIMRKDLGALRAKWSAKVAPMLADETFAAGPGFHCNFCPFGKDKGGPCKFGGGR